MPEKITKVKGGYRVSTPNGTKSKHTSRAKADAQVRLLRGVENGWRPTHARMVKRIKGKY
jgi:hypothetical protein